jgi:hypothetical protein
MPALLALLVRFGTLFSRLPGIAVLFVAMKKVFDKMPGWFKASVAYSAASVAEGALSTLWRVVISTSVMICWGIFLAAFFTGMSGLGIKEIYNSNPFSGIPGNIMGLVCAAFPIHFGVGLMMAYISWKFTVGWAALIMARTMKLLFGA